MSLLVRMNYILDYPEVGPRDKHVLHHYVAGRTFRYVCRASGPLYDRGQYREIISGSGAIFNGLRASGIDTWRRALGCTLRNFVHLLPVLTGSSPRWQQ